MQCLASGDGTLEFEALLHILAGRLSEINQIASEEWVLSAPNEVGEEALRLVSDEIEALHDLLAGAQAMRTLEERIGAVAAASGEPPASWRS